MQMHENRYIDFLLKLIYLVLILAGIVLFFKYVFKWLIPDRKSTRLNSIHT